MDDQLKLIISAVLEKSKSEQQINAQLKQIKTETLKLGVSVDDKIIKSTIKEEQQLQEKLSQTILKRNQQNRQNEIKQAEAINKSLDEEYVKRLKNQEIIQKQISQSYSNNNTNSSTYWQGNFKDAVSNMTGTNEELLKMRTYYTELEKATASENLQLQKQNALNKQANNSSQQKYWQGQFKDNINSVGKTSDEQLAMKKYYSEIETEQQKLQNQKDQFNAKNLNAIDLEIQKQEQASKAFSNQLKSQMQSNVDYSKQADSLEQIGIKANIGKNRLMSFTKELKETARQEYATTIKNIANSFDNVSKSANPEKSLKQAELSLRDFQSSMKSMGNVGDTVFTKLGKNVKQFWSFMASATISMGAINAVRSMIDNVKTLDDSLTELSKVTNLTKQELKDFANSSFDIGKTLGKTGNDVINATATFAQAGYDMADSTELATKALKLTNVAENIKSTSEAASILTRILKGFREEASSSTKVLDILNEVDILLAS